MDVDRVTRRGALDVPAAGGGGGAVAAAAMAAAREDTVAALVRGFRRGAADGEADGAGDGGVAKVTFLALDLVTLACCSSWKGSNNIRQMYFLNLCPSF